MLSVLGRLSSLGNPSGEPSDEFKEFMEKMHSQEVAQFGHPSQEFLDIAEGRKPVTLEYNDGTKEVLQAPLQNKPKRKKSIAKKV